MTTLLGRLGAIDDVVKEFFLVFARFEYALKTAGFVTGDENTVKADWETFARSISNSFGKNKDDNLREACYYILTHAPRKQVLADDHLAWKYAPPDIHLPEEAKILLTISRIRENLLHGGTFTHGYYEEVGDDERLLRSSLVVLERCLYLNSELGHQFDR